MTYTEFKQQLFRSSSDWNSFTSDKKTVGYVCAMVNSGLAIINEHNQIYIKKQYRKSK